MAITVLTYLAIGRGFVIFGILHLIGFTIVVAYPFLPRRRRFTALGAGLVAIAVGMLIRDRVSTSPWLIPLGINQLRRPMLDWYPILPWGGVPLLGIWAGHALYPQGERRFSLPDLSGAPVIRQLASLGRVSLLFYLVHQPVLLGVLFALDAASLLS
jgi:uncharacterized membrane protein